MARRRRRSLPAQKTGRAGVAALASLAVFAVLASMPIILSALHLRIQPAALTSSHGVALLSAPRNPAPVSLPAVARPIEPNQGPATLPPVSAAREAALVSSEDSRVRVLLHDAVRVYQPEVLTVRGSLPTLVLTAGAHPYTARDLATYGALVMLPHHGALLLDNIFVSTNAKLDIGPPLRALYLDNSTGGFASIVAWGGGLSFQGTAAQPLTIMGWDRVANGPAVDRGDGRPYIREVGGRMTISDTRVSALGFWSGRTGGVAWTGVNGSPSTGYATNSTFTANTYGAFISRGVGVKLSDDLFEFNQLDGVHIHRYSVGSIVTASSSSRNGGNGFLVDRATQGTTLLDDVSENNTGNGIFVDGRPLVNGASASGSAIAPGSGTVVEGTDVLNNARTGILVEGGTGTVLKADQVCAKITAIGVRSGATNTVLTGNYVSCGPRSGLSLGPLASGTTASGNTIVGPRIGVLVRDSGPIRLDNNIVTQGRVFGISARGANSRLTGVGNILAGTGFRAVDARALAPQPTFSDTNTQAWQHHLNVTFFAYLRFHPLAALWLTILLLVVLAWLWSHRRRLPAHPYPATTHWSPVSLAAEVSAELQPALTGVGGIPPSVGPARPAGSAARQAMGATAGDPAAAGSRARPPWEVDLAGPAAPRGDRSSVLQQAGGQDPDLPWATGQAEPESVLTPGRPRSEAPWSVPPGAPPPPPRAPVPIGAQQGPDRLKPAEGPRPETGPPEPADETKPMPRLPEWP